MSDGKKKKFGRGDQGSQTPAPSLPSTSPDRIKIAIIGGRGQMGRWFKRFFESQGLEVLVAGRSTPQTPPEVARQAQVVVLSVPIPRVEQVVREVAPYLKPDAALMDLTSVKQVPMAAMLAHFQGEVVGTHPLFGPGEKSLAGRTVVLCPGRGEKWFNWLKDLLVKAGARVKVTTATEHDRFMAVVQGLAHFVLIALGATIRDLGVNPQDLEDFATPTFATLHRLTRHLLSQDAKLYACIQLANPANRTALRALEAAVAEILYFIQRQNADGLVRLIESVKEGFTLGDAPSEGGD
jgi:prephenate dehydrogenase